MKVPVAEIKAAFVTIGRLMEESLAKTGDNQIFWTVRQHLARLIVEREMDLH